MERKEKLKVLLYESNENRHLCTRMSLVYPDPVNSIGVEKDSEGNWSIITDQCYPGLFGISYCPFCGLQLSENK